MKTLSSIISALNDYHHHGARVSALEQMLVEAYKQHSPQKQAELKKKFHDIFNRTRNQ